MKTFDLITGYSRGDDREVLTLSHFPNLEELGIVSDFETIGSA